MDAQSQKFKHVLIRRTVSWKVVGFGGHWSSAHKKVSSEVESSQWHGSFIMKFANDEGNDQVRIGGCWVVGGS